MKKFILLPLLLVTMPIYCMDMQKRRVQNPVIQQILQENVKPNNNEAALADITFGTPQQIKEYQVLKDIEALEKQKDMVWLYFQGVNRFAKNLTLPEDAETFSISYDNYAAHLRNLNEARANFYETIKNTPYEKTLSHRLSAIGEAIQYMYNYTGKN